MDQDTVADLSVNVARLSDDLVRFRRDMLAQAGELQEAQTAVSELRAANTRWQVAFEDLARAREQDRTELEQMHRDIATLCGTLAQIVSYATPGVLASALDSDAPMARVQEAKAAFEQITERIVDVMRRHERPVADQPPDGMPVYLWTPYIYDQEPLVAPDGHGMACYEVHLASQNAELVMYTRDGQGHVFDPTGPLTTNMMRTYWTGVPGHRRDPDIEHLAVRARLRREPNAGETDETY